ncbi:hypothetical protein [Trichloromonas acetexigens]|uniref:hypothetical protein n=1 Tax=Trichloromonas acetexigens TaxID=38815 RepID=UPI001478BBAA|nr:hypothetical protein [Desulfuromonas acetexigens]
MCSLNSAVPPRNASSERTVIVHAWQDDIVPEAQVTAYARYHQTELHLVNSDHRPTSALPFIRLLFQEFLEPFIPE